MDRSLGKPARVGFVLGVIGAAIGLEARTFEVAFLTDPVGPKALPFVSALILIVAGAHIALRSSGTSGDDELVSTAARTPVWSLLAAAALFVTYAVVLPVLGFFLCTTAAVAMLSRLFGAPAVKALLAAGALSAVLWLLFVQVLALPLPIGSLWIR